MTSNEWQHRFAVGSLVYLGGEPYVVQANTRWVTLRAQDGTVRRMRAPELARSLSGNRDSDRRKLIELMTEWRAADLSNARPDAPAKVIAAEDTESHVREFVRSRVVPPGAYGAYGSFASWLRSEHGVEAPTESDFLRALANVFEQDPSLQPRATRQGPSPQSPSRGSTLTAPIRPGQSLVIRVTLSIVDGADGKE